MCMRMQVSSLGLAAPRVLQSLANPAQKQVFDQLSIIASSLRLSRALLHA